MLLPTRTDILGEISFFFFFFSLRETKEKSNQSVIAGRGAEWGKGEEEEEMEIRGGGGKNEIGQCRLIQPETAIPTWLRRSSSS